MLFTILIALLSLIILIVLHELGHFVLAKKFGVKVEEFGIGFPPRIIGKKIGETIYSLNLLPLGAFVKLYGETETIKESQSFSGKPIWQRVLIVLAGVVSFWLVAFLLLSIIMGLGAPIAIDDSEANHSLRDIKVQIIGVAPNSPAESASIRAGDTIREFKIQKQPYGESPKATAKFKIQKVNEVIRLTDENRGNEIILTIQRGEEVFEVSLIPRVSPPEGEGAMGVALARTAIKSYLWYQAPWEGLKATGNLTWAIVDGLWQALTKWLKGQPTGADVTGPVGIVHLFAQVSQLGLVYFLNFMSLIAIYLAIFNLLPIPALDGGKILFLVIEKIRSGKPVPQAIEQKITAFFFLLLILLMVFVTWRDITRIF